jgi:hypothetical protein
VVDASFTCGVIGRVVVVNWHTDLTRPAMRRAFGCILAARREVGAPLVNVSVIPPRAGGPAPEYTANTEWHIRVIDHVCEAIYIVHAGHSVTQMLWRGVMSVAALALRMEIASCSTVEEAFDLAGRRLGEHPSAMLLEARARGLVR